MNNKILTLIIPCFGKPKEIVMKTIESALIAKKQSNTVEIIFVYKNVGKKNYDWVNDVEGIDKIIKIDNENMYRMAKIALGYKSATGKFILILDSDDLIIHENINMFIDELKEFDWNKDQVIITNYLRKFEKTNKTIECNDSDMFKSGKNKIVLANFNWFLTRTLAIKIADDLYKTNGKVFNDDLFLALLSFESFPNIEINSIKTKILCYIKYLDNSSSLTSLIKNIKQIESTSLFEILMTKQFHVEKNNKVIFSETFRRLFLSCWFETKILKTQGKIKLSEIYKFYKGHLSTSTRFKIFLTTKVPVGKKFILRTYIYFYRKKHKI